MLRGSFVPMVSSAVLALAMLLVAAPQSHAQFAANDSAFVSAYSVPSGQLIEPAALNLLLQAKGSARPLVLQVGSHLFFNEAHISGSIYAGPGSQASGLQLMASKLSSVPKNRLIVIYCGCCPWSHCPNIGPAFKRLHELGFTNVKALFLPNNFGDDWVAKGYHVDKGE